MRCARRSVCPAKLFGFDNREQIVFFHDQQLIAIDLDGLAAVLAEQDAVADFDAQTSKMTNFRSLNN